LRLKTLLIAFLPLLILGVGDSEGVLADPQLNLSQTNIQPNSRDRGIAKACAEVVLRGLRPIAKERTGRFLGKVREAHARCWGGNKAVKGRAVPWVDWQNYWGTGDITSKSERHDSGSHIFDRNQRGLDGALINLEYQRMELIKFNLFDNKTFEQYLTGDGRAADGSALKTWKEMRLPENHPNFHDLKIQPDGAQLCQGALIRHRTLTGICNDIRNPAMGSTGQLFSRNVEFESTFPDLERDLYSRNRHGGRLSLLKPDPQVISRKLFTRDQSHSPHCNEGKGIANSIDSDCDYKKAPFFNVLAAFWVQFMTHDWFSHLEEGRNDQSRFMTSLGCTTVRINNVEESLTSAAAAQLGCRPEDKMEVGLVADNTTPTQFQHNGRKRLSRSYKTFQNFVTAWWDASQIYGFDQRSRSRLRRASDDPAKLEMVPLPSGLASDGQYGYLPMFRPPCDSNANDKSCDPIQMEWRGQEAVAFPDNWSIGLSFLHNLFAREHNIIVDTFRRMAREQPSLDSGLRDPDRPTQAITYSQLTDDELFEIARLIISAEIAKIHTTEWTTQLLYDEALYTGMNSNWSGLFDNHPLISKVIERIVQKLGDSPHGKEANQLYSAFASGPGIVGRGNRRGKFFRDGWDLSNPDHVNGGVNHFGSPFNFPEEFVSVYRLHPLVPDILEFRELSKDPNIIRRRIPVIETFRVKATDNMHKGGLANWALTMGRQRLGLLVLRNHSQFLQNIDLRPRLDSKIDLAALDIIRDREHGIPRFNEFRRQIGLRQLSSFDDFIDLRLPKSSPELAEQLELVKALREIYGQHLCDDSKVITTAQLDLTGRPINDCLGHPNGTIVDNVEDVDIVVGFLAETTRPHGFAISETQFQIFIINASRRLFSDRFLTSSFRPEFYTKLGIEWVMNSGPTGKQWEKGMPNGHRQEVSPLKRVLLRAMPELASELKTVVNAFDPWARERGKYYSLDWIPRPDATGDEAFKH
jgi:hypothetical protein